MVMSLASMIVGMPLIASGGDRPRDSHVPPPRLFLSILSLAAKGTPPGKS
jgi:hypothetical protein